MIFSKYLVTFLCLLLIAASGEGRAASASTDAASDSTTATSPADAGTSTSHKHHRKHHGTTDAAASSSTTATSPTKTSGATSSSTASTSTTPNSKKANGKSATADATPNAPATDATTTAAASTHSTKKKHGASTAAVPTSSTSNTPGATAGASVASPPSAAASPAGTPAATTAAGAVAQTAVTAKTGRHRHHKAAPLPPPIVVAPSTTPLAPIPQTAVTLPVTAPLSGVKLPPIGVAPPGTVPTVMTGLPVARPGTGTTATLPIGLVRNPPTSVLANFPFTDYSSRKRSQTYPWKTSIVTTVFWIGEDASAVSSMTNHSSAWDINWENNNGGADAQYDLNGYASSQHASMLNPFYVALPFNDLAYPDEAARWLPSNWSRPERRNGKQVSACQGRWVEIKNRAGRVCFAQWEDVGPLITDNAEYVFGPERPSARAGLDVSPAVAKYLGIDSTAYTSWRFVDDVDVQPGMWLRYDEQALLFRALREQMRGGGSNRPLQDLSEPVPDDSSEDANQKKAGAARG